MSNDQTEEILRKVVTRAAWRLNVIEIIVLIFAVILALSAGSLAALMFSEMVGISYRTFWTISSLLFFTIPGCFVFLKIPRITSEIKKPKINGEELNTNG